MNASYSNSLRCFQRSRSSCVGSKGPSRLNRTSCCGVATVAMGSIWRKPSRRTVSSTLRAEPSRSCARTAILRASSGATTRDFTRLAMALDESEHALPGVLGGLGEVLVAPVEEAVRGSVVRDELVLHAGVFERLLEGRVVLGGDVLVVPCLQSQDRRADRLGAVGRAWLPVALGRHSVEADRAGEAVAVRRGKPRVAPTEAEADREDRAAAELSKPLDRRGDIGADSLRSRLRDVIHVLKVVVALLDSGRAPEVVDRERGVSAFGEPQCELLVEAVEPADVREDHDAGVSRLLGGREEGRELVAVARLQHEILVG